MNGEPLVEKKPHETSARYRLMADRLDRNASESFGGACVIVPPAGVGEPIEVLMLGSPIDPVMFWSTIQSRIQVTLEEIKAKQQQPFSQQRR